MKKEEFDFQMSVNGKRIYRHIETGKKREQILKDRMSGKMSKEQFEKEQKKMRGGKYLKYLFSEQEYLCLTEGIQ